MKNIIDESKAGPSLHWLTYSSYSDFQLTLMYDDGKVHASLWYSSHQV